MLKSTPISLPNVFDISLIDYNTNNYMDVLQVKNYVGSILIVSFLMKHFLKFCIITYGFVHFAIVAH